MRVLLFKKLEKQIRMDDEKYCHGSCYLLLFAHVIISENDIGASDNIVDPCESVPCTEENRNICSAINAEEYICDCNNGYFDPGYGRCLEDSKDNRLPDSLGFDLEREACGESFQYLVRFAKDIVDNQYYLRTKNDKGEIFMPGLDEDQDPGYNPKDASNFASYDLISDEGGEYLIKRAVCLMEYCWSPFKNTKGIAPVDCEIVKGILK